MVLGAWRGLLLILFLSSMLALSCSAKKLKKAKTKKVSDKQPPPPDPFQELIGEIREIVKLGLDRGADVEQVCSDACGLLDNERILRGKFMKDYLPFCEKQCPLALNDSRSAKLLESHDLLMNFILEKFKHDEL